MENIKVGYMPVGQVVRVNSKTAKIKKFIKENKLVLIIGAIAMSLISAYALLIINFIKLIQIIN